MFCRCLAILIGHVAINARPFCVKMEVDVDRLPTPQQDLETAWIYRDIWPVLEREMLTAMAFNSAAAPSAVAERSLTPEELATAYERQGGWPLVAEAARVRCRSLLGSHQKISRGPCARRLEKQR
jgi:hypothetical protein